MATLASLADGAKVKLGSIYGKPIIWRVIGQNHYASGQTSLQTESIIKLMCFDAMEASNSDSDRRSYGNNNYALSNFRQWLNSDAASWYSAQHSADAPPSNANVWNNYNEYDAFPGFLNGFTADEKAAICDTTITYGKASVDGGGTATVTDKVFPLSCTEMGLSGDHVCGTKFSIYSSDSARIAKPTAEAVSNSEYTNSSLNTSSGWYYWLRDAYASGSHSVRLVGASGSLGYGSAFYGGRGARPALNLSSSISISSTTDSDGCYTLVFNNPPEPPGSLTVPSTSKWELKSIALSWTAGSDPDGDALTYEVQRQRDGGSWEAVYSGSSLSCVDSGVASGTAKVTYRVRSVDTSSATSGWRNGGECVLTYNKAPGAPASITPPAMPTGGSANTVSWAAGTDPDGDTLTYRLQRQLDGGSWLTVYEGSALSFEDSGVAFGSTSVAWRVCSVDPYTAASGYTATDALAVTNPDYPVSAANFVAFLKNCLGDGLEWRDGKINIVQ